MSKKAPLGPQPPKKVPRAPKKGQVSDAAALERVRAELEAEYVATFGCPSTLAPWGTPWKTALREAEEADRSFIVADQKVTAIIAAIEDAAALLKELGRLDRPYSDAEAVGLTVPEILLYQAFGEHGWLPRALQLLCDGRALVAAPWTTQVANAPKGPETFKKHLALALGPNRHAAIAGQQKLLEAKLRRACSRRLLHWDPDQFPETVADFGRYVSVFGGVPPRAPGTEEWRRAILVQVLDIYLLPDARPDRLRRVTDREIAVVALLQGGVTELSGTPAGMKLVHRGTATVVARERKAVSLARGRRTTITKFMRSKESARFREALEEAKRAGLMPD